MPSQNDEAHFVTTPRRRGSVVLEAFWELMRARVDTLPPARRHARLLGRLGDDAVQCHPGDEAVGAEIGRVVERVARLAPFRARCLQQAIAVRRMLARRGVPATVHLGIPPEGGAAHAWVTTGGKIVVGGAQLDRHVVIGSFT